MRVQRRRQPEPRGDDQETEDHHDPVAGPRWVDRVRPTAEEAAEAYPHLRDGYAEQRGKDPRASRDTNFRYGLDRVLDGLETRITH
ncbi:hypothetical protein [Streptomyces fagopyri]|uniref:hypothetical protein n=1 Tax=Streptomyces fagopyri TaxID=2662397 RepID=UPI0037FC070A